MIQTDLYQKNKRLILEILKKNENQLLLLELKIKSKLPNLYFFKTLRTLENENIILQFKKRNETWIKIDQVNT